MDQHRLDALTRTITRTPSRRDVLRGLAALGTGLAARSVSEPAEARRRRRHRCRHGKTRLSNRSCAIVCVIREDCPSSCYCSRPNTEGAQHCIGSFLEPYPVRCTTTDDCPRGSHCEDIGVDGKVCIEVCH